MKFYPAMVSDTDLTASQKLTYRILCDHDGHRDGIVWPSLTTIARKTSCGISTVKRSLIALERLGLIARTPGTKGRSTRYRLNKTALVLMARPCADSPRGVVKFDRTLAHSGPTLAHSGPIPAHSGPLIDKLLDKGKDQSKRAGVPAGVQTWGDFMDKTG